MPDNKGFILVELLVVVSLIVLLSAAVFVDFKKGEKNLILQRNAYKLAQDIKKAQEMTMSAKQGYCGNGFGIHFDNSLGYYVLFADCDDDKYWDGDPPDDEVETIYLDETVEITDLKPATDFSVFFVPPDPVTWINNFSSGQIAKIEISCKEDASITRTVIVNNAGRIEIK